MAEVILELDGGPFHRQVCERLWKKRGGMFRIDVTQYRPRRSDRQNRYYWPGVVKPFAAFLVECGQCDNEAEAPDQAHEILKHKFLRRDYIDPTTGHGIPYTRSTTELDTTEFNEYLDRCAAWLAELGIEVQEPQHETEAVNA